MGLFDRLFGMSASTPGPADDFWFNPVGVMTSSGQKVDTESARKLSAWYRARDIIATSIAMMPLKVFERLPNDDGSETARQHPLYDILHDKPNTWQDAFVWKRQATFHVIDHGNHYSRIIEGSRGFVDQLQPIDDPTSVTPELNRSTGRILYHIRQKIGTTKTFTQDEIFHLKGPSDDGVTGKGILKYARESLGTAQAVEDYASRIFSQGVLNGGWIKVPALLNKEASERMAASLVTQQGKWHMPAVLEQGAEYAESKMSPEDFQMLLSRKFTIDEMARWTGVPRMMLENSDPSYGNADQFSLNFVKFTMGGWMSMWEFGCNDQLVLNRQRFFVEFMRDALERADLGTRSEANSEAINSGWRTVNEVRRAENLPRIAGEADKLRIPQNITGKPRPEGSDAPPVKRPVTALVEDDAEQARAIVVESAARVIRKETKAIAALAVKHAGNSDRFAEAVADFYAKHADFVSESLLMAKPEAEQYCANQAAQVLESGLHAIEPWAAREYAVGLAAWALETEKVA